MGTTKNKQAIMAIVKVGSENGGTGENGATFTPSVSEDGVLSWTNDKGLDNPDPVNIKGTKGDKGATGKSINSITGSEFYDLVDNIQQLVSGDLYLITEKSTNNPNGADYYKGDIWKALSSHEAVKLCNINGKDGYTPVKGTDYFTEADKTEIANAVLDALEVAEGGLY
jgi:hypothetical protein